MHTKYQVNPHGASQAKSHKQNSMCKAKGYSTSFADLFHHSWTEDDRTKTPAYSIYQTKDITFWLKPSLSTT